MISIGLIVFREALEISLILGILLAATQNIHNRLRWIWGGFSAGVAGSLVIASFAAAIAEAFEGIGQDLLNAMILITAGILIAWTVIWMEAHGKNLSQQLKSVARDIVELKKPLRTLSIVIALAVLREGSEIILFTYGFLISGQSHMAAAVGILSGLSVGFLVGFIIYQGLVRFSARALFQISTVLLAFMASGMIAQGMASLAAAGVITVLADNVWDSSSFLPEQSWAGAILKSMIGYSSRPMGIQLLTYLLSLSLIFIILYAPVKRIKQMITGKIKHLIYPVVVIVTFFTWDLMPLRAEKIYSPHITGREIELETHSSFYMNDWATFKNGHGHKIALGISPTSFWFTELYGAFNAQPGAPLAMSSLEWENRFMLAEPGEWFIDTGLYLAYAFSLDRTSQDDLEFKVLLEKDTGKFTHRLNPIAEFHLGGMAPVSYSMELAYGGFYRLSPFFEPGFETYMGFGQFNKFSMLLGPVVYGKIGFFKYEAGYLFDLASGIVRTDSLKINLEYEIYF